MITSTWLQHPVILEGTRVKLIPLESAHIDKLVEIGQDQRIWELMTINGADATQLRTLLSSAILKRGTGEQYPFTVIDKVSGAMIGCTMFHNIFPAHRKLEIGWTWYHPGYWRTGYNRECKLLLLTYCFEQLKTLRVQFQVDQINVRSCTAVEGLGASREGLLRNDRITASGRYRNTVMFSIIDTEWPVVQAGLAAKIK